MMQRKCDLAALETFIISSEFAEGKSTSEVFKIIGRYQQTVKSFVTTPMKMRKRAGKGQSNVIFQRAQ